MAVLGLLGRGFLDDFGVEDEGEVENNFLEDQGLGETDLVLRGAGLGVVKFDTEAAKMQCKWTVNVFSGGGGSGRRPGI